MHFCHRSLQDDQQVALIPNHILGGFFRTFKSLNDRWRNKDEHFEIIIIKVWKRKVEFHILLIFIRQLRSLVHFENN